MAPLYRTRSTELTLESLETAFWFFGEFVEDLKLQYVRTENILASCHNLNRLSLRRYNLKPHETHALQNQIELLNLNELKFDLCIGITNQWLASKGISNVTNLKLENTRSDVNHNFIEYFKSLTSLTVILSYKQCDDIIFDIMERIQHRNTTNHIVSESFARLITDKLHKLENLELHLYLTDQTIHWIQLQHLKSI